MVRKLRSLLIAANFIFLFLAPQSLWAVCSSPAGEAGQILFQTPNLTFCDGTNWIALGSGGSGSDNMGNHTASQNIVLGTNWLSGDGGNEGVYVNASGSVGINTSTIVTPLTVNGALSTNIVDVAAGTTTLDLSQSNFYKVAFTGNICTGLTLNNMVEGTTYTVATNGVTAGTCSFSSAGLTFSYAPQNGAIANDAIYTMMKVGTTVYVSWLYEFDAPAASGVVNVTGTAPISSSGGTNPDISISQANSTTNGYLSSADWNTFNNKVGLTCSAGQVLYHNGTNWVCEDSTAANTASTLVYRDGSGDVAASTITMEDALVGNGTTSLQVALNTPAGAGSYSLTLPTNDGNANEFLQTNGAGVLTWASTSGSGDNMGNHTASQNIVLGSHWLSGDGGNEGIRVDSNGQVGIGAATPSSELHVGFNQNSGTGILVENTNTGASSFTNMILKNATYSSGLALTGTGDASPSTLRVFTTANTGIEYNINNAAGDHVWKTNSGSTRMRLSSAGNLGVGNITPARLLHVNGPMRLTATTTPGSPAAGDVFIDSAASNALKYYNGSSWVSLDGSVSAGGSTTEVQYNNSGALAGSSSFVYDNSKSLLKIDATVAPVAAISGIATDNILLDNGTSHLRISNSGIVRNSDNTYATGAYFLGFANSAAGTNRTNLGVGGTADPNNKLLVSINSSETNVGGIKVEQWNNTGSAGYFEADTPASSYSGDVLVASADRTASTTFNLFKTIIDADGTPTYPFVVRGDGNVGIGTTTPGEKLDVNGNVQAVMFVSTSDKRLKKNIEKVNGLESIQKLDGVTWKWKESGDKDMGVIAQDVEKLFPWAVTTNKSTGYKAVKYDALIAPLIEATKELSLMCDRNSGYIDKIDRKLSSVDSKVEDLEKENKQLKDKVESLTKYLCERDPNAAFCR